MEVCCRIIWLSASIKSYLAVQAHVFSRACAVFTAIKSAKRVLQENPMALIESPKLRGLLPKSLTEADVEALLDAPDLDDPIGLRDRTMLEVLYACGLRVTELVTLTCRRSICDKLLIPGDGEREVKSA